jgi:siroheme synthase-like protein
MTATAVYPVNLVVEGRRSLVVGGGSVALAKVRGLHAAGAVETVVAPVIHADIPEGDVTIVPRPYESSDIDGMRLVVTATDDAVVNHRVFDDAEAKGIWVNAADDPERCTVLLPAVVRRGQVVLTASTSGASPALSSWLRGQLETAFGDEYAVLAELLGDERSARLAAGERVTAADWHRALDSDMLDLIRAGEVRQARERLQACLSSSSV